MYGNEGLGAAARNRIKTCYQCNIFVPKTINRCIRKKKGAASHLAHDLRRQKMFEFVFHPYPIFYRVFGGTEVSSDSKRVSELYYRSHFGAISPEICQAATRNGKCSARNKDEKMCFYDFSGFHSIALCIRQNGMEQLLAAATFRVNDGHVQAAANIEVALFGVAPGKHPGFGHLLAGVLSLLANRYGITTLHTSARMDTMILWAARAFAPDNSTTASTIATGNAAHAAAAAAASAGGEGALAKKEKEESEKVGGSKNANGDGGKKTVMKNNNNNTNHNAEKEEEGNKPAMKSVEEQKDDEKNQKKEEEEKEPAGKNQDKLDVSSTSASPPPSSSSSISLTEKKAKTTTSTATKNASDDGSTGNDDASTAKKEDGTHVKEEKKGAEGHGQNSNPSGSKQEDKKEPKKNEEVSAAIISKKGDDAPASSKNDSKSDNDDGNKPMMAAATSSSSSSSSSSESFLMGPLRLKHKVREQIELHYKRLAKILLSLPPSVAESRRNGLFEHVVPNIHLWIECERRNDLFPVLCDTCAKPRQSSKKL